MNKGFIRLALLSQCLLVLSGCAVMSKEECLTANWQDVGYNDGLKGAASAKAHEYVSACSEYIQVDLNAYNTGRKQGAEHYCTDDNGYNLGVSNASITDICHVSSNEKGFNTFYNRGQEVYKASYYVTSIDNNIRELDRHSGDLRLGPLHALISANREYLASIRGEVYNYYLYVNENARNGSVKARDYSGLIANVPYPEVERSVRVIEDLLHRADKTFKSIHDRMRDNERCLETTEDENRRHQCLRRLNCLQREDHRLRNDLDQAIYDIAYTRSGASYVHPERYGSCIK